MIPLAPDQSPFTVVTASNFDDRKVQEEQVAGIVQEARMWETFARLVKQQTQGQVAEGGGGEGIRGKGLPFWKEVSLGTQLCMDALLKSAKEGGGTVHVDPDGLLGGSEGSEGNEGKDKE